MNNFLISTRLKTLVTVMSLLLIAVGLLGLNAASSTNESLRTVYEDRTVPLGQLTTINQLTLHIRLDIASSVLDPTQDQISESIKNLDVAVGEASKQWKNYMSTYLTPEEARVAKQFEIDRAEFIDQGIKPAIEALRQSDPELAHRIILEKIRPLYVPVETGLDALMKIQFTEAQEEYRKADQQYKVARFTSIGLIALGVAFAIGLGTALIRSINSSLTKAIEIAHSVTEGDLVIHVKVDGRDEVSKLIEALVQMQCSLGDVVSSVRKGAHEVAVSSAEIAQGNFDLSSRTENQASALEQTAASMEQLGAQVQHNSESAQIANRLAREASHVAVQGGEVVSLVVSTMQEISASSRRIGDIIGVIDSIAFQTNILALNAAVEAARAGEQGRGFAVVASEVRSLARRSAEAAKEIKSLIQASVARVEHGSQLVDQAGLTMNDVVSAINRVNDLMGEISEASKEQALGVSQVSEAVSQMDQFTQQNAALVEESAASAEALRNQADQLSRTVAVFHLANDISHPAGKVLTPFKARQLGQMPSQLKTKVLGASKVVKKLPINPLMLETV